MLAPAPRPLREPGPTFAIEDIGWFDFETRGPVDIKDGTYRYMQSASPLILAYAVGDGPISTLPWPLTYKSTPKELREHHRRVAAGEAVWAAWHAAFDREVWNQTTDFPELEVEQIIDVMAQATAAGLPGQLDFAGRFAGCGGKTHDAKKLIALFTVDGADPKDYPQEWAAFLEYAGNDVSVMRDVFKRTLQLPIEDWEEYWASERINLRGIKFDRALAQRAEHMAKLDKAISAAELTKLTDGAVTAVTQVKRMTGWLNDKLDPIGRQLMTRRDEEIDEETGEVTKPAKHSLTRHRITLLLALLGDRPHRTPAEDAMLRLLQIRHYGGSTTPAKFSRMLETCVENDELLGMFVFNGAPQTGRFSSRVTQLHNLMRDALPYELDAIDALLDGCDPATFATLGDSTPICRKLSMLIRPTLVPDSDHAFVWGDWSQIEARVLPWLAGGEGEPRLDIFREVDADPSVPDLYTRSAADLSGLPIEQIDKPLRQRGKVSELALGFGGGRNALQNMAANYGMHIDNDLAIDTVRKWREVNTWAVNFWAALWTAVQTAMAAPGEFVQAGRVAYVYLKDYLGGTLLCRLPSGRMLTYRRIKWEQIDETDDDGVIIDSKWELTYARGFGRVKLWHGVLAENVTQASAACVLRGTLVRLKPAPVRAHTHDEVLLEVPVHAAEATAASLVRTMEQGFEWSAGLPLKAEATCAYSYSKCEAACGL